MLKKLIIVCLINFLIAAIMGLILRYSFIDSINLNYRFLTHAHSHVAMLGWMYLTLYTFIVHYFIVDKKPIYTRLFWITEIAVIGMMVSFPFQGYAAISISFSTLHILCSYYFVYLLWKHHKTNLLATSYLLRASLLFMLLSTIGVWCLGPAIGLHGKASVMYQIAIQFFLHFQFNGWFLFAVLAIFFHLLKVKNASTFRLFFKLLLVSTFLTLALPIYWFARHKVLLWLNGIGVLMQLYLFILFIKLIKPKLFRLSKNDFHLKSILLYFSIFCFGLKIVLQSISLIPEISEVIFLHRNFVIGFIHLTMLGVITGFLFYFILRNRLTTNNKVLYFSSYIFLLGFILSEVMIVAQGGMFYLDNGLIPNYYFLLFLFSILLPIGIFGILFNVYTTSFKKEAV